MLCAVLLSARVGSIQKIEYFVRLMRLDKALVEAGLAPSRARAAQLIAAGAVKVAGVIVRKASLNVTLDDITLTHNPIPWVSRAALKLVHALKVWNLSPEGATAYDIGASTGGFTEVLLHRGAQQVYAIDVGHGQLAQSLTHDQRVINLEGVNARTLPVDLPAPDWIVSDVSFISLTKALPDALSRAGPGAHCLALIKPQFEVGPAYVGKGGIVRDQATQRKACDEITAFFKASGWKPVDLTESPVLGSGGNQEFLIHATKG